VAAELCRRALGIDPRHAPALHLLGLIAAESGRPERAVDLFGEAIALDADAPDCATALGEALLAVQRPVDALASFRRALQLEPTSAEAHDGIGSALRALGHPDAALACHDAATSLPARRPELAFVHRAAALMELGRLDEALGATDQALARNPRSAQAWFIRSELKRYARGDADLARLEALLEEPGPGSGPPERTLLCFAAAKALLDVGDDDRAFARLHEGNRLERGTFPYDSQATYRSQLRIARAFRPALLQRFAGGGHRTEVPVFVVGMPRSGTTLIEQVLASHPSIHGAGELPMVAGLVRELCGPDLHPLEYPRALAATAPAELARLGRAYADELGALAPGKARVVDKMHDNFLYAGLIHLMLPEARIIHCRRDARDTCLSCYTKRFGTRIHYAYDLGELGLFYRGYEAVTARWRMLLPADRYIEVRYEDVVADAEREARRLVAFLGLDWDAACLEFHRIERPVRTASAVQVRQPLYATSVGRWRAVARQLGPLLDILNATPDAADGAD